MWIASNGIAARVLLWMDEHHLLVILPLLGILASIGIFVWTGTRALPEPEPLRRGAEPGVYCYADVRMMSRWILKVSGEEDHTYYQIMDAAGAAHIVSLNDEQYAQFAGIVAYTRDGGEIPPAQRLTGIVTALPGETLASLADAFDVDEQTFAAGLGRTFLNAKATLNTDYVIVGIVVLGASVLVLLLGLICTAEERAERRRQKRQARAAGPEL